MPTFYRVHHHVLAAGDIVPSSGGFAPTTDVLRTATEDAFAARRPAGKPDRRAGTFVFESAAQARDWALKYGGHLYEVEVAVSDILHRADWTWLDKAAGIAADSDAVAECANAYWAGAQGASPVIELLVANASVLKEISISDQERAEFRAKRYQLEVPKMDLHFGFDPPAG